MSQVPDFSILATQSGEAFAAELTTILQALASNNAGPTAPAVTYAGTLWLDTGSSPAKLKKRNEDNDGWELLVVEGFYDIISMTIDECENKTYRAVLDIPFAGVISMVSTKSASGSCTVATKINGVNLGGSTNSATTTLQQQVHTSSNVFAAGDTIEFQVSSNSACRDLSVTVRFVRVF